MLNLGWVKNSLFTIIQQKAELLHEAKEEGNIIYL
jgi:hypothetical protein